MQYVGKLSLKRLKKIVLKIGLLLFLAIDPKQPDRNNYFLSVRQLGTRLGDVCTSRWLDLVRIISPVVVTFKPLAGYILPIAVTTGSFAIDVL